MKTELSIWSVYYIDLGPECRAASGKAVDLGEACQGPRAEHPRVSGKSERYRANGGGALCGGMNI